MGLSVRGRASPPQLGKSRFAHVTPCPTVGPQQCHSRELTPSLGHRPTETGALFSPLPPGGSGGRAGARVEICRTPVPQSHCFPWLVLPGGGGERSGPPGAPSDPLVLPLLPAACRGHCCWESGSWGDLEGGGGKVYISREDVDLLGGRCPSWNVGWMFPGGESCGNLSQNMGNL